MFVLSESELMDFWMWSWLTTTALDEITPEALGQRRARFQTLTFRDKVALMTALQLSDWYT